MTNQREIHPTTILWIGLTGLLINLYQWNGLWLALIIMGTITLAYDTYHRKTNN